ncbi:MAG: diaminopimelate epimerase [Rikenellaceae bacterium]|nr:diaminopimelate epimerase [Rikenellaceae bacterium]
MIIRFSKYEGAGNDFIILDARDGEFMPSAKSIAKLCDRHKGIGGDGVMILDLSHKADVDFRMRYYNADGFEGTMCGNGGRCIALFAHYLGIGGREKLFEGVDGLHSARIIEADDNCGIVELGIRDVDDVQTVEGDYLIYNGSYHVVRFVECVEKYDVDTVGRELRYSPLFTNIGGVNVNFVETVKDGVFKIRTYERGVENETLACGTGATASAIAARLHLGSTLNSWTAEALGGTLRVKFDERDGLFSNILLTGPARQVFTGKFDTNNL